MHLLFFFVVLLILLSYFLIYLPLHHKQKQRLQPSLSQPNKQVLVLEDFDNSGGDNVKGNSLVEGAVQRALQGYLTDNCECVNQHGNQFSEKFTYYWRNKLRQHEKEYCDYLSKLSSHDRARYLYQWLSTQIYHAPPCTELMVASH
jgi:hypothetical protein